jgi:hypothetical protein
MSHARRICWIFVCALAIAAPARAGELKLEISDGKVTLIATDVPVRQILSEWARIGQTRIINAEKLSPAALTLHLEGVPERQALDIILRSASGYMAAPRLEASAGRSVFDLITIMATSTPVANTGLPQQPQRGVQPPAPVLPPNFRAPGFPGADAADDQEAVVPQPNVNMPMTPLQPGQPGYIAPPQVMQPGAIPAYPGGPIMLPNGQIQQQPPPQGGAQYPFGVPAGGSVPGMISPQPQSGVPTMPNTINPLAPKKPGGQ